MWHLHHLACSVCAKQLTATTFFEHHGELLCAAHHAERAAPRCAYCAGAITDRLVTALNKPWHVDHFFCSQCGTNLVQATGFMEHDGKPYCADDYFTLFAPACGRCAKPVMADCITALNKSWHPGCFTCATCSGVFAGGTFFAHEGLAYCEMDFHRAKGTLCEGCLKPIVGKCVNAAGRRWHPQCFLCSYCKTSLNKNPFREREGKAFCVPCHTRLYG
ncbi:LIM domain protein [Blastocladiella britannica]|nr:LIM domain protein [Blastocladiella britannica]